MLIALLGFGASLGIPKSVAVAPGQRLDFIVSETRVPVIPIAIAGLWGSMFSRYGRRLWQRLPRKLWHRVVVNVGEAVAPEQAEP